MLVWFIYLYVCKKFNKFLKLMYYVLVHTIVLEKSLVPTEIGL